MHDVVFDQLMGGNVYRYFTVNVLCLQLLVLLAGFLKNPGADRNNQAGILGNRDESSGRNQSFGRAPPQQGFDTDHLETATVYLWLVVELQFVAFQGMTQITFDFQQLGSFSIIRRSAKETAVDVPIVRARIDAMAFPAFK